MRPFDDHAVFVDHRFADLGLLIQLLGLGQADLQMLVLNVIVGHHGLGHKDPHFAGVLIKHRANFLVAIRVVFLVGSGQSGLNGLHHDLTR